jgi:hypothetical protein
VSAPRAATITPRGVALLLLVTAAGCGDPDAAACDDAREAVAEAAADKVTLPASGGDGPHEFVVLMKKDLDSEEYPFPPPPGDPETGERGEWQPDDPLLVARVERIAELQACAVAELEAIGGTYVQSFWLINAFSAEMTLAQAYELAERADIRFIEASETGTPPPARAAPPP